MNPGPSSSGHKKSGHANRVLKKRQRAEDELYAGVMAKFLKKDVQSLGANSDGNRPANDESLPEPEASTQSVAEAEGDRSEERVCPPETTVGSMGEGERSEERVCPPEATVGSMGEGERSEERVCPLEANVGSVAEADQERMFTDIAAWPIPVTQQVRVELVKKGYIHFQNKEGPFTPIPRPGSIIHAKGSLRSLNTKWFYKELPTGEKVLRTWMAYSPTSKKLYCFCCRLFSTHRFQSHKFVSGFDEFWRLHPSIKDHEESNWHLANYQQWKTLQIALGRCCTIDNHIEEQKKADQMYWRKLLDRLLHVTLFLAKQNLAFRGHDESTSSMNRGNFVELVSLLGMYDPILKEHMMKVQTAAENPGQHIHTYLSPEIQNEFIELLGDIVRNAIIQEIKDARIYGIMFDSTPDISRVDQFSQIIRYVHISHGKVEVKESFIRFIVISGKTAQDLTSYILEHLRVDGLDIQDCRAQGYDNAATMAGVHGGVQAKIKDINPQAIFVPCANHSLNLCGVRSFEASVQGVTFFGTLEKVFAFFSASTHRWEVMKCKMQGSTLKRLSTTRWSAHYESVRTAKIQFAGLLDALECLTDSAESTETRSQAESLNSAVCTFSFLCHLSMWYDLLKEVNNVQIYLQRKGLSLEEALIRLNALSLFLESRDSIIDHAVTYGEEKCAEYGISMEQRQRRRRRMPGEQGQDAGLSLREEVRRSLAECYDRFSTELDTRKEAISKVAEIFSLLCWDVLMCGSNEDVLQRGLKLADTFPEFQTDDDSLLSEVKRLRHLVRASEEMSTRERENLAIIDILKFIVKYDFQECVPNITLGLKLYLTTCVSVASCERSFSKLKLIKNYLRSSMGQERLCSLAILSIENEKASEINFEEAIDEFATRKSRKVRL